MATLKDMTGEQVSMLKVIKQCPRPEGQKRTGAHWLCRCECGKEVRRSGNDLRKPGKFQSCGCSRSPSAKNALMDLTGQKFGKLIAIRIDSTKKHRRGVSWICQCECGSDEVTVLGRRLRESKTEPSCGCNGWPLIPTTSREHVGRGRKRRVVKKKPGGTTEITFQERVSFYEPGRCPNIKTCGPCQRAGRSGCFYSAERIAAARVGWPERSVA